MSRRRAFKAAGAGLVIAGMLAAGSAAAASPGDPDGTFGSGGRTAAFPGSPEDVVEAGGRVYTASTSLGESGSTVHLRAFTTAGVLDPSFSSDGMLDLAAAGSATTVALGVDADGRLVVVAGTLNAGVGQVIWRLQPDGALDPTFSGDGSTTLPSGVGFSSVTGVGFQPDGDVIIGTNDTFIVGGFSQLPRIVRLTEAGAVAQSVDVVDDFTQRGAAAVLEVDGSGRPYVLLPDDGLLTIRRYTDALSLDPSYSGDGIQAIARPGSSGDNENWGGALHVADSGVALVAGTVGTFSQVGANPPVQVEKATLVARVTATGALDTSFSTDGIAAVSRPSGSIAPVTVAPTGSDGVALVAWRSVEGGESTSTAVWQLTSAGAAENGFSGDGRVEREQWSLGGAVSASGTRLYLLEYSSAAVATLVAVQLVAPAPATVPAVPAAPTVTSATATSLGVSFKKPATGGSPITSFDVLVYEGSSATPVTTLVVAAAGGSGSQQTTVTGLTPAALYRFKVRATNAIGDGPLSAYSAQAIVPFTTVDAFVKQQYADFTTKAPTPAQLSSLRGRLIAGTITPVDAVVEVAAKPEWATLDPLTRIYYAYFGRVPDSSGLRYWLTQRRAGRTVDRISSQFAASNEFKRKYGSLTNRAFVELVYQNVLQRNGDAGGIKYWTGALDRRVKNRGQVMVQFSESREHIRRRTGEVNTVSVIFGMLHRGPRAAELTAWVPQLTTSKAPLVSSILSGPEYGS